MSLLHLTKRLHPNKLDLLTLHLSDKMRIGWVVLHRIMSLFKTWCDVLAFRCVCTLSNKGQSRQIPNSIAVWGKALALARTNWSNLTAVWALCVCIQIIFSCRVSYLTKQVHDTAQDLFDTYTYVGTSREIVRVERGNNLAYHWKFTKTSRNSQSNNALSIHTQHPHSKPKCVQSRSPSLRTWRMVWWRWSAPRPGFLSAGLS